MLSPGVSVDPKYRWDSEICGAEQWDAVRLYQDTCASVFLFHYWKGRHFTGFVLWCWKSNPWSCTCQRYTLRYIHSPNVYPVVVLELELELLFWLGGVLPLSCILNIKTFSDGKDALKYCCVLPCVWVNTIMRNY